MQTRTIVSMTSLAWLLALLLGFGVSVVDAQTSRPKAGAEDAKEDEEEEEEPDRYLAIEGGILHPTSRETVEGSTVLCKNGKIVAIGPHVEVPDEAEIIDASGLHIYPGLVALNTSGFVSGTSGTDVFSLNMALGLAGGLTTVASGSAIYKLTYGTLDGLSVKNARFEGLSYSTRNPRTRRTMRAAFERVWQHLRDVEEYNRLVREDPKAKKPDEKWIRGDFAKAKRLIEGESTALVTAIRTHEILQYTDLARKYGFQLVVRGAREGHLVAGDLARAGATCIVTPRTRSDRDPQRIRENGSSPENAAILHDHGVPVIVMPRSGSISLMGLAGQDLAHLPMEAAFAVRGGMSEAAAIDAITVEPARLLGLEHRVGTIEVGKDADFAITDGDLLHYMTLVQQTVVNGRIAYDKDEDSLYGHIRPAGDDDAPPPNDHWPRRLGEDW